MSTTSDPVTVAAVLLVGSTAAVVDARTRRIPNVLTAATAMLGLALAATGVSGTTVAASLMGAAVGLGLMLPGHVFGATGAGDVKLLASLGAMLGPGATVAAFLYAAIAGGLLALGFAMQRGRVGVTLSRSARLLATPATTRREIEGAGGSNQFPYGPAIAVGALLAALGTA